MKKEQKAIRPIPPQDNKRINDIINMLLDEIVEQTRKMAIENDTQPSVFMLNFYQMVLSVVDHIIKNAIRFNTLVAEDVNKETAKYQKEIDAKTNDKNNIDVNAS